MIVLKDRWAKAIKKAFPKNLDIPMVLNPRLSITLIVAFLAICLSSCSNEAPLEKPSIPDYPINRWAEVQLLTDHPIEVVSASGCQSSGSGEYLRGSRTTDGWAPIFLRTSSYLVRLNAGSWFSEQYAGEQIPRLDECEVKKITIKLLQTCQKLNLRLMAYVQQNTWEEYEAITCSPADLVNLDRPELYIQVLDSLRRRETPELDHTAH
uniref:Uncharacterized protein n=1 Tax=Roseihalotalea indica TaxID=2867963 RepID=A0AA49JEY3_9BACT|nr:hypothetical protein K4G66_18680 [Tunicatimonas sp. TK19036]